MGVGSFSERLAREDHRFLDTLEVSHSLLGELHSVDNKLPYTLGRALEKQGRVAAAEKAYQFSSAAGVAPWAGLAAIEQARVFARRGDWGAAHAWAVRATEGYPQHRDGWFLRGEALYRMEEYGQLLTLVDELPPERTLAVGEQVSMSELRSEVALWIAVAQFSRETGDTAGFINAFITVPAGQIHSRLYLYLYYRAGALDRFSRVERLLLEGVYRAAVGEKTEAVRLLTMIEPEAFVPYLEGAYRMADLSALPGLFATLDDVLTVGSARTASWLERIEKRMEPSPAAAEVSLLRARDAVARNDSTAARTILRGLMAEPGGAAVGAAVRTEVRTLGRERYIDLAITDGSEMADLLRDLRGTGVTAGEYELVVDRLLPALVRGRRFGDIEESLTLSDSANAVDHMKLVLAAADAAGLYVSGMDTQSLLQDLLELPVLDYFGLAARVVAGVETDLSSIVAVSPQSQAQSSLPSPLPRRSIDYRWLDFEEAAGGALILADALVTAGDIRTALTLALRAAWDPETGEEAMALARRFSDLGYHSAALDLARRAHGRSNLPFWPGDLELLYPPAFQTEIEAAAKRHGIPPALLTGLVREESHFRRDAQSHVGARGLSQLMPATADDVLRRLRLDSADLDNPEENLRLGAYYLDYLGEHLDVPVIRLAAYNAGLGRGRRWVAEFGDLPPVLQIESLPFVETRWYLRKIAVSSAVYQWFIDGSTPERVFQNLFGQGRI